ncbi:MAG: 8-amino-7-oxononanoate synthase [Bdellovibrionota bacterium]
MEWTTWAQEQLRICDCEGVRRSTRTVPSSGGRFVVGGRTVLNFSSNDYLDLARDRGVTERAGAAITELGLGSGSARLVSGTLALHEQIEAALAALVGKGAALLFSAGYLANLGMFSGICSRDDRVVSDKAIHASLIDGILLSRADHSRFRHNDVNHAEMILKKISAASPAGRIYVVTEAVFSMDGDTAPIQELAALAQHYGATLIVDQAHALGVFGAAGEGLRPDLSPIVTGTLSKAFGAYGGFIGGPPVLRELLLSRSRQFIFNTSLPPAILAGAIEAIKRVREAATSEPLGKRLLENASFFREELGRRGFDTLDSTSHIVPVLVPGNAEVMKLSQRLLEAGILVPAIRAPTVAKGKERLRFSLTTAHERADLLKAADTLAECAVEVGVSER